MDDHSVGVRSTLPMVKNYYSNQLNINHPLQHGSSLFLENTVKVHKVQQQQHVAGEGVTGLKNNDSLFEGSYYDNKLPLARGSSIDYFSVHKPASRVLAMEPHSNRSIRTTSGLQFGVPPTSRPASSSATAGANTILGFSQSQSQSQVQDRVRPTTAPLQRANITEMYPHLDAKIRKQQVEQRYVAVDYTKPLSENPSDRTSSLHHGTKLYSQYSRPYAHTNTNTQGHGYGHGHGLFTQSVHTHSHSQSHSQSHSHSQLLRPYTAGPGGHNASMVSNVSWGQSVYLGESGDSGDPAAAPAVAVASSRSGDANSRDDDEGDAREINFAPRASSSTDSRQNQQSHQASKASQELPGKAASSSVCSPNPTPRYAQPKSLSLPTGHKAMIGKQVAVPERVKLRRNRPLTSPDGYNLYSS